MIPTLPIQITCPSCKTKYTAQVQSIIDVGQNPQLKAALLRGQLNMVVCPSCHTPGMVSTPLLYHDPDKELLLLFVPPELNLPLPEREKLTGSLVNALMTSVPAEKRKGYFLNPLTALSLQGLVDKVLEADGVTPEMLEKQRARSRLLQDLLRVVDDEAQLQALIDQHKAEVDYPLFLTLAANLETAAMSGQEQAASKLVKLRDILLARTQVVLPEPLPMDTPTAQVVDRLLSIKESESRWAFVMYNRPLLDYAFFQELTSRVEKASPADADALRDLRTELLQMTEQLDKEAQEMQEAKLQLLQDVLASPDPAQTLRDRKAEIDSLFLAVLGTALRNAEKNGKPEDAQKLRSVNDATMQVLQDSLPPELRFVNNLLSAEYPEGTRKMLEEHRKEWGAEFLDILSALADDVEAQGRPEAAQRLKDIRAQAEALLKN